MVSLTQQQKPETKRHADDMLRGELTVGFALTDKNSYMHPLVVMRNPNTIAEARRNSTKISRDRRKVLLERRRHLY